MKTGLFIFLLIIIHNNAFSQKELVVSHSKGIVEEYEVIKNGKNEIKDGSYIKYRNNVFGLQLLKSGSFREDFKTGHWKYYFEVGFGKAKNTLKEEGTYVFGKKQGVWRTYYPDSANDIVEKRNFTSKNKIDSIEIKVQNNFSKIRSQGLYLNSKKSSIWNYFNNEGELVQQYDHSKDSLIMDINFKIKDEVLDHPALFIGGDEQLNFYFLTGFNFGYLKDKIKIGKASVVITFKVTEDRKIKTIVSEESNVSKAIIKSLIKQISESEKQWLAAVKNGHRSNDQVWLKCTFDRVKEDNLTKFLIHFKQIHK
ncbi:MAG: hypothetical protein RLO81_15500 [Fulvivirga sp.]|uniref:hypothetical protein n=1 Tax=Fulvivirga sp. TaxID=1931237 RepID=UPI0032EDB83A